MIQFKTLLSAYIFEFRPTFAFWTFTQADNVFCSHPRAFSRHHWIFSQWLAVRRTVMWKSSTLRVSLTIQRVTPGKGQCWPFSESIWTISHCLTPFFHGSPKGLHHGKMGSCHEKISVLLRIFFTRTINGQQSIILV